MVVLVDVDVRGGCDDCSGEECEGEKEGFHGLTVGCKMNVVVVVRTPKNECTEVLNNQKKQFSKKGNTERTSEIC